MKKMKNFFASYALLIFFTLVTAVVFCVAFNSRAVVDFFVETSERNISQRLMETSKRLSALVRAEELAVFRKAEDMKRPDYQAMRQKLFDFAREADVLYVYYLRAENGKMQYIIDNDYDESTRVGLDTPAMEIESVPKLPVALAGRASVIAFGEYTPGWDGLITAYSPIFDHRGRVAAVAGVDVNDKAIVSSRQMVKTLRVMEIMAVIAVFVSGLFGFITYRRKANAAQAASVAKNRFMSHMSHEIRTPLNAIISLCEMIEKDYGKPRGLEHLAIVKRAGRSLVTILNDILDFSRIESGNLQINKTPYWVASIFNDVITICRMRLEEKGVQFTTDISPDIPGVMTGDETKVREILYNLLSNAIKYTEKGFVKFTAYARREENGDQVALTFKVADSGLGMKPEDMDRLFADFCRIDDQRAAGISGTGLGLSITRQICRAMGGDVEVTSEYRVGSTFTAIIRQTAERDSASLGLIGQISSARREETDAIIAFRAPDFRVLIVDDNEMNLIVAEGLLKPYDIITTTCQSGKEAVARLKELDYDLVLLDHMMPEMDGLETAAAIRSLGGRLAALPIVALTANVVPGGIERLFLRNGFNDFLSKPVEILKLNELLERWVPRARRRYPEIGLTEEWEPPWALAEAVGSSHQSRRRVKLD
jgi:signal transduction histidine kinase/CheY-like chemotaxis protein